jgi:hypothetical protein
MNGPKAEGKIHAILSLGNLRSFLLSSSPKFGRRVDVFTDASRVSSAGLIEERDLTYGAAACESARRV